MAGNVFQPMTVELFRSPGAPVLGGWSALTRTRRARRDGGRFAWRARASICQSAADNDLPIGSGITEWRGDLTGEALVATADLPRFRPASGPGNDVFATTQPVELEAARDPGFTGADNQFPNPADLIAGTAPSIRRRTDGAAPLLRHRPAKPSGTASGS